MLSLLWNSCSLLVFPLPVGWAFCQSGGCSSQLCSTCTDQSGPGGTICISVTLQWCGWTGRCGQWSGEGGESARLERGAEGINQKRNREGMEIHMESFSSPHTPHSSCTTSHECKEMIGFWTKWMEVLHSGLPSSNYRESFATCYMLLTLHLNKRCFKKPWLPNINKTV